VSTEQEAGRRVDNDARLRDEVDKRVRRMERAERDRQSLLAQSVYMGTIAGLFVVPLVVGAYLGNWLDGLAQGYSVRWTVGMIVLGVVVGSVNVYLFIRERQ
jgi:ATP synthase protein I